MTSTTLHFLGLPTAEVRALQSGGLDANGQPPERRQSDGGGNPCRHCLQDIQAGEEMLILSYRPFPAPQPYAEVGPIFLHGRHCTGYQEQSQPPAMFLERQQMLIRGYSRDNRIIYGTGRIVATADLKEECAAVIQAPDTAYVHLRSASNNCFQCRVERTGAMGVVDV
jgi:hypothetical protein